MRYSQLMAGACSVLLFPVFASTQEQAVEPVFCTPEMNRYDGEANSKAILDCAEKDVPFVVVTIPAGGPYYISRKVEVNSGLKHMVIIRSTVEMVPAKLVADPSLGSSVLVVRGSDFAIYDIEVDGNKFERDYSEKSSLQLCRTEQTRPANIEVHGERFFVYRVKTRNAPCGSGLGVFGHGVFYIYEVTSENNGWPEKAWPHLPYQYADGITVVVCRGGNVYNNILRDNTDFDLLFGGGNCRVTGNVIYHDYVFGFGGLNLGHMDTGSVNPLTGKKFDGDHSGSVFAYNRVISKRNMLMYGLSIGSHPFTFETHDVKVFDAGTFVENSSSGAQINFAIDGVDKGDVRRNRFDNPQGDRTEFNTCATSVNYFAGHLGAGFVPQDGFVPMTIDAGRSVRNGTVCKR